MSPTFTSVAKNVPVTVYVPGPTATTDPESFILLAKLDQIETKIDSIPKMEIKDEEIVVELKIV